MSLLALRVRHSGDYNHFWIKILRKDIVDLEDYNHFWIKILRWDIVEDYKHFWIKILR